MKREIGIEMVRQAFRKGVEMGDISDNTEDKYVRDVIDFFNTLDEIKEQAADKKSRDAYNPKFWTKKWVDKHYGKLYKKFHSEGEDSITGGRIEGITHAFGKLQQLVNKHGVWKSSGIEKVRVGLKGSIESESGRLYENYLEGATSAADETSSIKATDMEYRRILNGVDKVIPKTNPNYQTIKNIITSQRHTGGRITAEVNLKAGDIDLTNMNKLYDKDKNKYSRRVPLPSQQKGFYQNLTVNKAKGAPLFPLFGKNGKQMDKEAASKYMQNVYKKVAENVGLVERDGTGNIVMRYTSHSTRRCFAQEVYDSTRYTSSKNLDKRIKDYINSQGSNKEGIQERIERERIRLNYYNIKNGLPMKDFTWNQKRKLLVMLHLGHSRIDICKRYINEDKPFWKKNK